MPRTRDKWDQRIDRARELAQAYPYSAEILLFYSKLTAFQKASYLLLQSAGVSGDSPRGSLPATLEEVDLGLLMTHWGSFLSLIAGEAPAALAEFARGLKARGPSAAPTLLRPFWPGNRPVATATSGDVGAPLVGVQATYAQPRATPGAAAAETGEYPLIHQNPAVQPPEPSPFERFCAQAFLQPYAEFLADRAKVPAPAVRRPTCPFCGSPPLVGVLRQEGDGAKRSLVCSLCRTEWDYLRIACPACEERREEKLCVYSTPAFECLRVEACDTCRAYIKTVDLTKNGLAVPEVDELAAIPLTLWADENGYRKVSSNLLGL